jgi:hypothetical protein
MIRPKAVHRNTGSRLSRGMAIVMSDGFCGRVEGDDCDTIVVIQYGYEPNDHLMGYRAFGRRGLTIQGNKAMYDWKSTASVSRPTVSRERRDAILLSFEREKLARSWESALD